MLRFGQRTPRRVPGSGPPRLKLAMIALVLLFGAWQVLTRMAIPPPRETPGRRVIPLKPVPDGSQAGPRAPQASAVPAAPAPDSEPNPSDTEGFLSEFERLSLVTVVDQRMPLERGPFMFLLKKVASADPQELESHADPRITYTNFAVAPERCRGHVCRLHGKLMRVASSGVDVTEAGIGKLYEGQIIDNDWHWYSFYVIEEPIGFAAHRDLVELVGVFYKVIVYETRAGGLMPTPLIIARRLKPYTDPGAKPKGPDALSVLWQGLRANPLLSVSFAALACVLTALLSVLWVRRRAAGSVRENMLSKKADSLEVNVEFDET